MSLNDAPWKTGDEVTIRCDGCVVDGLVIFASGNGQSLMLGFDAILAGHCTMMPVLEVDGAFQSLVGALPVELEPRQ